MDSYTGKPRCFGVVEIASAEDGDKAIAALNGTLPSKLEKLAIPKRKRKVVQVDRKSTKHVCQDSAQLTVTQTTNSDPLLS